MGIISKAHRLALYIFAGYLILVLALCIPYIQRGAIYLHWVRLPIRANFDTPEKYGITPGKVRNFYLTTPDGAKIGVWHAIPEAVYIRHIRQSSNSSEWLYDLYQGQVIPQEVFDNALKSHKTVLYSHGNAASRAQGFRTSLLRGFTNPTFGACDEGMNFIIYDYRGFADSSPARLFPPSEQGLIIDVKTVWNWIVTTGAHPKNISIIGQSLGTAVSAALAHKLVTEENIKPKALCLIAPFTSIPDLLKTYSLFKVLPILQPLALFPSLQSLLLDRFLTTRFNTKSLISSIKTSIILIHAKDDMDVHPSHSRILFDQILQNATLHQPDQISYNLPPPHTQSHFAISEPMPEFKSDQLCDYGTINSFNKIDPETSNIDRVIYLDANQGGHNRVGYSETALRAMAELICTDD